MRFLPGVTDRLVVLGPLLRPLIELHWARDVARWTGVSTEEDRLRRHLFGSDRVGFPAAVKSGLVEIQEGRCFYCSQPLGPRVEIDHFLAWSRWPNDAIENLVAADHCNGAKSDHLADASHLHHWFDHVDHHRDGLVELATSARWISDAARSVGLVRSTYSHIARGTPLWVTGREFVESDGPLLPSVNRGGSARSGAGRASGADDLEDGGVLASHSGAGVDGPVGEHLAGVGVDVVEVGAMLLERLDAVLQPSGDVDVVRRVR